MKLNSIFNSIKENCEGEKTVVFLLFPTSDLTMKGSKINFKSKKEKLFTQERIEEEIIENKNKCLNKKILFNSNQQKPIAYWVEFKI